MPCEIKSKIKKADKEFSDHLVAQFNALMHSKIFESLLYLLKRLDLENKLSILLKRKSELVYYPLYSDSSKAHDVLRTDLFFDMMKYGFFDDKFSYYQETNKFNTKIDCFFYIEALNDLCLNNGDLSKDSKGEIIIGVITRDPNLAFNKTLYLAEIEKIKIHDYNYSYDYIIENIEIFWEKNNLRNTKDLKALECKDKEIL